MRLINLTRSRGATIIFQQFLGGVSKPIPLPVGWLVLLEIYNIDWSWAGQLASTFAVGLACIWRSGSVWVTILPEIERVL